MADRTVLVLGGGGMVGYQVAHRIAADLKPERVVIVSLYEAEVEQAVSRLRRCCPPEVEIIGEWGDVFVREEFAHTPRHELLDNDKARDSIFDDLLGPLEEAYGRSRLALLIGRYRPEVVVDAVNTATAISYQDVYRSSILAGRDLEALEAGREIPVAIVAHDIETLILSQSLPQLIRHVMILNRAMRDAGTRVYLKIGTTGTGGMGLNIPYTHSEDRPSVKLMTKSAVAFAHTGLLFLMDRTPGGPIAKEIKPAALIGYSGVAHCVIREAGQPVSLYNAITQQLGDELELRTDPSEYRRQGELRLPIVDTGENGMFTKGEFEAITSLGQMEFVTPEEIARICVQEIGGVSTGRDVVGAIDASVLGPSYRGGVLRSRVLDELRKLEDATSTHSVALGQLGPPELSKLLWEAELLALGFGTLSAVLEATPEGISKTAEGILEDRPGLRDTIASLGLPILASDGATITRGPFIRIPEVPDGDTLPMTETDRDRWAAKGWVDLRPGNFATWQDRLASIRKARPGASEPGSAGVTPETTVSDAIETGAVVAWIFANELGGYRIK